MLLLAVLLGGCGSSPDETAGTSDDAVAMTTVRPVQRMFHDSIEAWGSAVGDPQHARSIGLAHGGQVIALAVVSGQSVARGQTLLKIAADATARTAYRNGETALTLARGELARTEQLAASHLATQSQLASARKTLADAQTALAAERAVGGASAEDTISAPADGIVTALNVGLGERVAANAPLLDFTPARALIAELGVQPGDAARLRAGLPLHLHAVYDPALSFDTTLRMVGQSLDTHTHLLPVRADLPAQAGSVLVVGSALAARIELADYRAWAVPRAAVLHDDKGDYLYQVVHGHARRVDIAVRHADGDPLGVSGPLDAGAAVIVLGAYELDDGGAVREQPESSG